MQNTFEKYIHSVSAKFKHKENSEMGYRTEFENLLKEIFESINVKRIDHDAKAIEGNKPDFVIRKFDIPILYIEAKDIGVSLDKIEKSEQMARYFGYANLVLTDYLEFRFYRNGIKYQEPIKLAAYDLKNRTVTPLTEHYDLLNKTLLDFAQSHKEPIRSGEHLAKIMGGKAQRIRDNLLQFLSVPSEKNSEINKIYNTLKKLLVHDLKTEAFADMYAQTLVYGLFVARYHDKTPENFTRREARELVPTSNPFLRHFFDHIVGADFDKRLEYIVDELCEVFSHADIPALMKQYFKDDLWSNTQEGPDPVIHFYEDFLREYDAELRKKLGAYYTPQPVVRFIVRAVDYLLKKEFNLPSGLADTSKTQNGIHKVQILDPAVGTGTFLSAVIRSIYLQLKDSGQIGRWTTYVHHDLLPRLHGFEIMMAPYTIAHLKLSMAFKATGFKHFNRRLGIYLTNSLEESDNIGNLFTGFGFAESIAEESKEAAIVKNETPIMVVIGNPPYSVSSANKGNWILNLIKDYKKDLNERKINLDDDYIKFIRYSEHFIEKNKTGIVAMITNNSFIDGITHRQMRKHLLQTFDEIYVLDLHGNAKKKETAPDGSKDENVFDIMQGVAIAFFIKNKGGKSKKVFHSELYGDREKKYEWLLKNDINSTKWKKTSPIADFYLFTPSNNKLLNQYSEYWKVTDIFPVNSVGIVTARDNFVIDFEKKKLERKIEDFRNLKIDDEILKRTYNLNENQTWKIKEQREKLRKDLDWKDSITKILYRPFDTRWIIYHDEMIERTRRDVMSQMLEENISLCIGRQSSVIGSENFDIILITDKIIDFNLYRRGGELLFPLYIYIKPNTKKKPKFNQFLIFESEVEYVSIVPNISNELINLLSDYYDLSFLNPLDYDKKRDGFGSKSIFYYIYAILYSNIYRKKYSEFLKIDFPRIPFTKDYKQFIKLGKLGKELTELHLLKSNRLSKTISDFPVKENKKVEKVKYEDEKVWINKEQYFTNVKPEVWEYQIGGYQVCEKWLKDRKDRTLNLDDIETYCQIVTALSKTIELQKKIDENYEGVEK